MPEYHRVPKLWCRNTVSARLGGQNILSTKNLVTKQYEWHHCIFIKKHKNHSERYHLRRFTGGMWVLLFYTVCLFVTFPPRRLDYLCNERKFKLKELIEKNKGRRLP